MSKKTLNILSIDWDYFIDADIHYRTVNFPDVPNEAYAKALRDIIWSTRYASCDLDQIGVKKEQSTMKSLIHDLILKSKAVCVTDSHRHCYDFTKSLMKVLNCTNLNLTNVDFHHDCYPNDCDVVDCGNWLGQLITEYPKGTYTWICDPTSDELREKNLYKLYANENFEYIIGKKYDGIFICKSGMWSPPHLDRKFFDTFKIAIAHPCCTVEDGALDDRYSDELKHLIDQNRIHNEMIQKELRVK